MTHVLVAVVDDTLVVSIADGARARIERELERALVAEAAGMADDTVAFFLSRAQHREVLATGGQQDEGHEGVGDAVVVSMLTK